MRHTVFFPSLLIALAPLAIGCSSDPSVPTPAECQELAAATAATPADENAMKAFTSEAELSSYMGEIEATQKKISACESARSESASDSPSMNAGSAASPTSPAPANEGITNNQESGADEGGIVKNIGDHLVVLRKGRLFAVDVAAAPTLSDSIRVAPTDGLNNGVWYDEMLVKGDLVYVVGYRYSLPQLSGGGAAARGATEIDTFRLTAGKLTRIRSMFLESNDYYSGSNYASRMVDGNLVFYMPHHIGRQNEALAYPRVLELGQDGALRAVGPMFGALDVTRSHERSYSPTFHTVVKCSLPADGTLECHGKAILGSWWREHYVSAGSLYLWSQKHAYRMSLTTQDVTTHAGTGFPRDQFSFKETADALLVSVQEKDGAALTKLPLAAFDKVGKQTPVSVPLGLSYVSENRFVGDKLVAAGNLPSRVGSDPYAAELVTVDTSTLAVARIPRKNVVRIEPLDGDRALVASDGPNGLVLSALSTNDLLAPASDITITGVSQGESRSHGFFFKPAATGGGTFGYAVTSNGRNGGFGSGISNLGFFSVAADRGLSKIGIVSSSNVEGSCETSCTDWYGNTRPIFLRERVFALMGSELAEVSLASGATRVGAAAELKLEPGEAVPAPF